MLAFCSTVMESVYHIHATNENTIPYFFSRFFFCFFAFVSNGSMFNSTNRQPSIGRFNENVQKMCQPLLFAYSFSDFHLCFVFGMLLMSLYSLLRSVLVTIIRTVIKLLLFALSRSICVYVCLLDHLIVLIITISNNSFGHLRHTHTLSVLTQSETTHSDFIFMCFFISSFASWRINDLFVRLSKRNKFCCFSDVLN